MFHSPVSHHSRDMELTDFILHRLAALFFYVLFKLTYLGPGHFIILDRHIYDLAQI